MARWRSALSWRTKLFLLLFIFSVAPVLIVAAWSFSTLLHTFETSATEGLQALARAKAEAIDQFMDYRRRDVERIANLVAPEIERLRQSGLAASHLEPLRKPLPELKDAETLGPQSRPLERAAPPSAAPVTEEKLPPGAEKPLLELKRTLGLILWDQRDFEEFLVIDPAGRVISSTFDDHQGQSASELIYFQSGRKATYVQPVFISPITKELTMVIATPIRNEKAEDLGVLAARLNLKRFFRLINDHTGLGRTGETVAVKKIDDDVVFMAPTRHDAEAALNRKVPIGPQSSKALQEAARGQSGSGPQEDYRGISGFAAWQYVPSVEWGLMAKMDRHEAIAGVSAARDRTIIITILVLLLIIPASLLAAGSLMKPLKELQVATDRISRGDFAVTLDIRSKDEIGNLANSFERMIAAIKFFREHSLRAEEEEEEQEELTQTRHPRIGAKV